MCVHIYIYTYMYVYFLDMCVVFVYLCVCIRTYMYVCAWSLWTLSLNGVSTVGVMAGLTVGVTTAGAHVAHYTQPV